MINKYGLPKIFLDSVPAIATRLVPMCLARSAQWLIPYGALVTAILMKVRKIARYLRVSGRYVLFIIIDVALIILYSYRFVTEVADIDRNVV